MRPFHDNGLQSLVPYGLNDITGQRKSFYAEGFNNEASAINIFQYGTKPGYC